MTLTDLQIAIENSPDGRVRIEAGKPDTEDHDTGYAWIVSPEAPCGIIENGHIAVAWDSGVRTVLPRGDDETLHILD